MRRPRRSLATTGIHPMIDPAEPPPDESEVVATIRTVSLGIAASTILLAVAAATTQGARFAVGVLTGGGVGLLNFLLLAGIGRAMTRPSGSGLWGLAYLFKVLVLFGGAFLLLRAGVVPGLGLVVGLCALLPGIVLGGLRAAPGRSGR